MYSKIIKNFEPVDIKLLRSITDIYQQYDGEGIDQEYMYDSNIEKGEICQLSKTPAQYHLGYFNKSGSGKSYYSFNNIKLLKENVDFIFC
jgi:hypothetical protein